MPAKFSTERPVKEMSKQPAAIKMIPGKNKSLNFTPPSPKTIAFGGVLMANGIPKEAAIATRIAVEGRGISA